MNNKYNVGFTFKEYLPEESWEDCLAMTRIYEVITVSPTESIWGYVYFVKSYIDSDKVHYDAYTEREIDEFLTVYEHATAQFNLT